MNATVGDISSINSDSEWDHVFDGDYVCPDSMFALYPAFSQDGASLEKTYVTHILEKQGEQVYDALVRGGVVFISGSGKTMPAGVKRAISNILIKYGTVRSKEDGSVLPVTEDMSLNLMASLVKSKRYIVDVWSS